MDCPNMISKDCMLKKISELQFVCVELNLYLNTHPDDEAAMSDYYCYSQKLRSTIEQYEEMYGPLMGYGHSPTQAGNWTLSDWPWEQ